MAGESKKKLLKLSQDMERLRIEMRGERGRIAQRIVDLEGEREKLLAAPMNRSDLEAALIHDLGLSGQEAVPTIAHLVKECRDQVSVRVTNPKDCAVYAPIPSRFDATVMALLLTPRAIVEALKPILDKFDFKDSGPPLAERRTKVAAMDAELAELRSHLAELNEALEVQAIPRKPRTQEPKPGDTIERTNAYGEKEIGTFAKVSPEGSGGWVWKKAA